MLQPLQSGREQPCRRQQNKRESRLKHDECFSWQRAFASSRATAPVKRFYRIYSGGHPRWPDAEGNSRQQRNDEGKEEDWLRRRPADWYTREAGESWKCEMENQARTREGNRQARRSTKQRQQDTFVERLPQNSGS